MTQAGAAPVTRAMRASYDRGMHDPASDYLPLPRAASLAHDRLFPGTAKEMKTLDMLALALSALVPLYLRDMESGALRPLSGEEVQMGRFTRGATRLEISGREPLRFLVVPRVRLDEALEKLAGDVVLAARVSLTLRHSPRSFT
jgi:hypothetical protein